MEAKTAEHLILEAILAHQTNISKEKISPSSTERKQCLFIEGLRGDMDEVRTNACNNMLGIGRPSKPENILSVLQTSERGFLQDVMDFERIYGGAYFQFLRACTGEIRRYIDEKENVNEKVLSQMLSLIINGIRHRPFSMREADRRREFSDLVCNLRSITRILQEEEMLQVLDDLSR